MSASLGLSLNAQERRILLNRYFAVGIGPGGRPSDGISICALLGRVHGSLAPASQDCRQKVWFSETPA